MRPMAAAAHAYISACLNPTLDMAPEGESALRLEVGWIERRYSFDRRFFECGWLATRSALSGAVIAAVMPSSSGR
jgi:hypothetical protein